MAKINRSIDVSIIIPVYNAEQYLDECLQSIADQNFEGKMELSAYNDSSTDRTADILEKWRPKLVIKGIGVLIHCGCSKEGPRGVGYARNKSISYSTGDYLCFLDADDVMHPDRVRLQYIAAQSCTHPTIIGSGFVRQPSESTVRFTSWANSLTSEQLYTQAYTSHGPTVIMPTWLCSRHTFDRVGGFDESGKGTPEDLIFFYHHLKLKGKVIRVDAPLLMYRYHQSAATFSVKEKTIWNLRVKALEQEVLSKWSQFTIWNASKQGRQLYRSLSQTNRDKVVAFCDVDVKKIAKGVYTFEESDERPKPKVPIVHFSQAKAPFIICIKLGLTGGQFESNLQSLGLQEEKDFYHFN